MLNRPSNKKARLTVIIVRKATNCFYHQLYFHIKLTTKQDQSRQYGNQATYFLKFCCDFLMSVSLSRLLEKVGRPPRFGNFLFCTLPLLSSRHVSETLLWFSKIEGQRGLSSYCTCVCLDVYLYSIICRRWDWSKWYSLPILDLWAAAVVLVFFFTL